MLFLAFRNCPHPLFHHSLSLSPRSTVHLYVPSLVVSSLQSIAKEQSRVDWDLPLCNPSRSQLMSDLCLLSYAHEMPCVITHSISGLGRDTALSYTPPSCSLFSSLHVRGLPQTQVIFSQLHISEKVLGSPAHRQEGSHLYYWRCKDWPFVCALYPMSEAKDIAWEWEIS